MLEHLTGEGVEASGDLLVSQRAAGADMSVDVAAGTGWVKGDDTAFQGIYHVLNDAVVNVAIPANGTSNPRVDRLVLKVNDSTVQGGISDTPQLLVVQGAPTSGATLGNLSGVAAVPPTALLLANVLVAAGATSIANANVTNVTSVASGGAGGGGASDRANITFVDDSTSRVFYEVASGQSRHPGDYAVPSPVTELFGTYQARTQADLTPYTQARLVGCMAISASGSAAVRAQYSTDGGNNWSYLDNSTGPEMNVGATGVRFSSWITLTGAAKADVQLRLVSLNGDGSTIGRFVNAALQLK